MSFPYKLLRGCLWKGTQADLAFSPATTAPIGVIVSALMELGPEAGASTLLAFQLWGLGGGVD